MANLHDAYEVPPDVNTDSLERGRLLEGLFFGYSGTKQQSGLPHVSFAQGVDEIIRSVDRCGVWSPENPQPSLARYFREEVCKRVRSFDSNFFRSIKLYPAIDTALDVWHGADGFFVAEGELRRWIVPFDISLRKKYCGQRRHHVLPSNLVVRLDFKKDPHSMISKAAKEVARRFKSEMEEGRCRYRRTP